MSQFSPDPDLPVPVKFAGSARFKTRIVQSSCLGLCPKKAMALAAIQPGAPLLAAEVKSGAKVAAFGAFVLLSFR